MMIDSMPPVVPQMIESNAIFLQVDNLEKPLFQFRKPGRLQTTFENGILNPLAMIKADFGDIPQSFPPSRSLG